MKVWDRGASIFLRSEDMKRSTVKKVKPILHSRTVGIDLGDRFSHYCVLDKDGTVIEKGRFKTTQNGVASHFEGLPRMRAAMETGTHSAWVSQLLTTSGTK